MVCLELEQFLSWFLRGCIRIREEGEGNSSCCTKQLIAKLKVLPILCAWNWRGSLGGSIAVQSLNRNESGGRKVQQLLTWEYFILITELRVVPFLCAWNWSGSLGDFIAVPS